jgi:DNA-binding transcriptional ArsR family regulator
MRSCHFETCSQRLKALANADRLRIVGLLRKGALTVSDIAAVLGKDFASITHHLAILRRQQVLRATRRGRFFLYELALDVVETAGRGLEINFGRCLVYINDTHLSVVVLQDGG